MAISDDSFIVNQETSKAYLASVEENTERELLKLAYSNALTFLLRDEDYKKSFSEAPFDMLLYLRVIQRCFRQKAIISGLLEGKYNTLDQACEDLGVF